MKKILLFLLVGLSHTIFAQTDQADLYRAIRVKGHVPGKYIQKGTISQDKLAPNISIGGSNTITTNASLITSGQLSDARLSTNIATISGIQTFSNKSISGTNNTFTNITQSSITGLVTDLGNRVLQSSYDAFVIATNNTLNDKQATLISGSTIKTINGISLLGTGDIVLSAGGAATTSATSLTAGTLDDARLSTNITKNTTAQTLTNKTLSGASNTFSAIPQSAVTNLSTDLTAKQATLVSGTNIRTVNGQSLLGSTDLVITGGASISLASDVEAVTGTNNTKFVSPRGTKAAIDSAFANRVIRVNGPMLTVVGDSAIGTIQSKLDSASRKAITVVGTGGSYNNATGVLSLSSSASTSFPIGRFGDAIDGDVTISTSTNLSRSMYYNNLIISNTLVTGTNGNSGFKVFVRGTLTINTGAVLQSPVASSGGNSSGSGAGGAGSNSANEAPVGGNSSAGPAGVVGASVASTASGTGFVMGGIGGTNGAGLASPNYIYRPIRYVTDNPLYGAALPLGGVAGRSGNSGAGDGTVAGGGGGSGGTGGHGLIIWCNTLNNLGTIRALGGVGGNGGNVSSGNANGGSGGGGGGGGIVYIICNAIQSLGTFDIVGGLGGNAGIGFGTGVSGTAGNQGGTGHWQVYEASTGKWYSDVNPTGY